MARILIVDDSPSQLEALKRMVEKLGHQTLTAADGAAGVEAARRDKPDLVLMDVILPGMNGFQATRTLTRDAETGHIPILIISTKGLDTDRVWGLRQGAKDYITKPPRESDLVARINALIGH